MKIGILTFHDTTNFGSTLQAFALEYAIYRLNYNCEIINYQCESIIHREFLPKFVFWKMGWKQIILWVLLMPVQKKKHKNINKFFENYGKVSKKSYTKETIKDTLDQYDKFIVGSDLVWNPGITGSDITYFLSFVDKKRKKYAFSSSIGEKWKEDKEEEFAEYLKGFERIAVREKDSAEYISKLIGRKVDWVADPTMLLEADEWRKYQLKKDKFRRGKIKFVLVYFTDNKGKVLKDAKAYAEKYGCKVYMIHYGIKKYSQIKNIKPTSVEEFLSLIDNAECVFTASYHGMLFSLYFNKEFWFYNRNYCTRMVSLSEAFNVAHRNGELMGIDNSKIRWAEVNNKINKFRKYSLDILEEMLQQHGKNL